MMQKTKGLLDLDGGVLPEFGKIDVLLKRVSIRTRVGTSAFGNARAEGKAAIFRAAAGRAVSNAPVSL